MTETEMVKTLDKIAEALTEIGHDMYARGLSSAKCNEAAAYLRALSEEARKHITE